MGPSAEEEVEEILLPNFGRGGFFPLLKRWVVVYGAYTDV
jgi:hypothetical protein